MRIAAFLHRCRCGAGALPAALMALAAVAAVATSGARAAADSPAEAAFKRLDRNGDGVVTFDEFVRVSDERLARMDGNGDGNIGRDEFLAYHEAEAKRRIERILAEFDKRNAGRLALADLAGRGEAQRLAACDADKDGALTRAEYLDCRRRLAERWARRIFAKYDKNGDSFIDRDERVAALKDFFARLDADGDGRVVREEFAAAHQRRMERRTAPPSDREELD